MEPIKTDLPTNTAEEKELLNLIAELIVEIIVSETESADYKNTTSCSNVFFRYIWFSYCLIDEMLAYSI